MKDYSFRFLIACIALSVFRVAAQPVGGMTEPAATTNHVVRQNLRLPDIRLHDPWILAHAPSKTYYLYTSNSGRVTDVNRPGTMVYRSKDLLNWEGPSVVFALPEGTCGFGVSRRGRRRCMSITGRFYLLRRCITRERSLPRRPRSGARIICAGR